MHKLISYSMEERGLPQGPDSRDASSATLIEVLVRRWRMLVLSVVGCLAVAAIYLTLATRVYSASGKILVEQNTPDPLGDMHGTRLTSETYVQTQADVLQSVPVLQRALDALDYRSLKTFSAAGPDPISWLRRGGSFKIDVAKKSDVIIVSMESPYADEAASIVNAVVQAYLGEASLHKRSTGLQMLASLQKEREELQLNRARALAAMQKFRNEHDSVSFGADRSNTALERNATLAASLTSAEMATMDLKSQYAAIQSALADPATLSAFVEAQQFKSKDMGDHEYDELRNQLIQQMMVLSTVSALQGPNNARVQTIEWVVNSLRRRIAEKERSLAQAHLVSVSVQLSAAEANEQRLRQAMKDQRARLIELGPTAAEYARLDADVARIQRQSDALDARISEISVNQLETGPLNVQFLEQASANLKPIKPNKLLILASAMMTGWILGIGLALMREWHDSRFHSADEIRQALGTTVIASVPRINSRLSPVARGQILHLDGQSASAEAYRSVRTSLNLGALRDAKTILVASPTQREGKSTTASNLAIAFAQAGHRTLLVDCDMREPVQHLIFETDGSVGVTSVVAGEATLRRAVQSTRIDGLFLLPCGPVPSSPTELLSGKRFGQLMRALAETFDRIVIDSPPVMMVSDARILAACADATLLVLRMNHSTPRTAVQAMQELAKVGANVLGVVANAISTPSSDHYYRGSWQYASSARRVLASLVNENGEADASTDAGRRANDCILDIEEPDWSTDQPPIVTDSAGEPS